MPTAPNQTLGSGAAGADGVSYPSAIRGNYVVLVLMLAYAISFIDRQIFSLLVDPIRADLEVSDTQLGLLQGFAFAIFYTAFGIPLGLLADRFNRRNLIIAGVLIWSLATAAAGLASAYHHLFLARLMVGVGEAALSPCAYSMISDTVPPHRRARSLAIYASGIFLGSGLALILGGSIVASAASLAAGLVGLGISLHNWQIALLLAGMPGIPVALLLLTISEPVRLERISPGVDRPSLAVSLSVIRARQASYATAIVALALLSAVFYAFFAWFPTIVMRSFGWSAAWFGWTFGAIVLICGPAGMWLGGWITDQLQKRGHRSPALPPMIAGLAGVIAFGLGVSFAPDAWIAIMLSAPLMICLALPSSLGPTFLQSITANEGRGLITALYLFGVNLIGLGIGPTLVAALSDYWFGGRLGLSLALVIVVAIPIAVLLFVLLNRRIGAKH